MPVNDVIELAEENWSDSDSKTKPYLAIKRLYGPELADIWSSVQCQKTAEGAGT